MLDAVGDAYAPDCRPVKFAECGTAACIGGWAILLGGGDETVMITALEAARLLDIKSNHMNLFDVPYWPKRFREAYHAAKSWGGKARIAASRIDHFIKTKGAE